MSELAVKFVDSIAEVGAESWNGLSGIDNPFLRYEFFAALEETGCTTRETGWQPCHAVVTQSVPGLDPIVGLLPLYLKTNSWGEYVFDWSWANAYESHGLSYYPKFVTSVPFTPSYGRRLLLAEGSDEQAVVQLLKNAIEAKADYLDASSWHVLFPNSEQHALFTDAGLLPRTASQFQWFNRDYENFEHFLQELNSRKRKNIRKERRKVSDAGVTFNVLSGSEVSHSQWQDFYTYYQSTYLIRGMQGYLNLEFFLQLAQTMPEQLVMILAEVDGKSIAAALFFQSADTLFGRYWGAAADFQFLHFETCYYQGQEYAIRKRLQRFDSGAQGEHKIQRGFEPVLTYSNHWIANAEFRAAIASFLKQENHHIERYREEAMSLLPYRQSDQAQSR